MRHAGLILAAFVTVSSPLLAQSQLEVSNASLPFGGVGQNYSVALTATGGSGIYSFSITGNLPPGLMLFTPAGEDSGSTSIVGQPTAAGAYSFTVTVNDRKNHTMASKPFTIDVMQISTAPQLPNGSTCNAYAQTFSVSDGPPPPFTWSFSDSAPPPGLSLNPSTGVLSGTPTSSGQFSFAVEAFSTSANVYAVQEF
jgi:hypothetical protein